MKQFVVLVAFVLAMASANFIAQPDFPEGRVLNGQDANVGDAPFMASLQSSNGEHFCGGTIINSTAILTACHCIFNREAPVYVQVGSNDRTDRINTQVRVSDYLRCHSLFNGTIGYCDIALIIVKIPFVFNSKVSAIQLPSGTFNWNRAGTLFGWGNNLAGVSPTKLQKLPVNTITYFDCLEKMPADSPLNSHCICTLNSNSVDGACYGDSGGPLVCLINGVVQLVGIVSWSYKPCSMNIFPNAYTAVGSFLKWIANAK